MSNLQMGAILDSRTYLNVHSGAFNDGEIRGQVIVPAPGAAGLLAVGGLVALGRRR